MQDRFIDLEASRAELPQREWDLFGAALSVGLGVIATTIVLAIAAAWWMVQS